MASNLLGVNFAHNSTFYNDNAAATTHLTYLYNIGIRIIRVLLPNWQTEAFDTSFRDKLRTVCTTALGIGHYVIWGYTVAGQSNLTNTTMTGGYHDAFTSMATWAQSLNYTNKFEIQLGNEDDERVDGSTVTKAQYQAYVRGTLADDVRAIFTKGFTSYSTHTGYYADWLTGSVGNLGSLHKFGLNLYGTTSNFDTYAANIRNNFGEKGYLSEFSGHDNGINDFASEELYAQELFRRMDTLEKNNTRHILFAYDQGSSTQKWAFLLTNGTYRDSWKVLRSPRKMYVVI